MLEFHTDHEFLIESALNQMSLPTCGINLFNLEPQGLQIKL